MYFNFSLGRVRNMYTHIHKCIYTYAHGPCVYAGLLYSYSFVSCISFATTYNTYAHTYIHLFSLLTHSHTHIRTLAPILPQAVEHIPLFLCSMHIRFEFTPFSCFFLFLHFFFASYLCSICNFIFLALTHLFWFDCYCRMVCMLIHIDIRVSLEIEGFDIICAASLHSHVSIAARWN